MSRPGAASAASASSDEDSARWPITGVQILCAVVFLFGMLGLVGNSIVSAANDQEAAERVAESDTAAGNAVYTQRESLVLANRVNEWLLGEASRRDVQLQRALLQRRLDVLDPLGQSGLTIAGEEYQQALAEFDRVLAGIPPGVLAPDQRAAQVTAIGAPLGAFEREASQLGSVYQSLVDENLREKFHDHGTDQQRGVLFLVISALSLVALLVVTSRQIRSRYGAARERIRADRAALDRASVLDRGEAEILAGIVEGRPSGELVVDVLDLAHELTGRCLRFVRAGRDDLSDLPRSITHRDGPLCEVDEDAVVERRWPVAIAGGDGFGHLEMCRAASGPPKSSLDSDRSAVEAVARRCADLVALVLDRAIAADLLRFRASHDPLTGMPNRAHLLEQMGEELRIRGAESGEVAVVFCDLDRFKVVNDTLGHGSGDLLLRAVAQRLSSVAAGADVTVARLGGDEFVALCVGPTAGERAGAVAEAMASALDGPFLIDGAEVFVAGSLGVSVASPEISRPEQLLRNADVAMYRAKADPHVRVVRYDEELEADLSERLEIDTGLRRAIRSGDLVVHLQPIVELATGRSCGVEALVRWQRGEELLYPGAFLGVARDNGLMPELGRIVIAESLDLLADHRRRTGSELTMWINLARVQVRDPSFPAWFAGELAERSLPARSVVLELSEGDLLDVYEVGEVLEELRAAGTRIAMDDFGTGYSSLVRLGKLPIDVVKLDREFVAGLGSGDFRDYSVLAAAVKFVEAVGLDVVVEGIERQSELDAVAALGCRYAQGYLLRRPGPAAEVLDEVGGGDVAVASLEHLVAPYQRATTPSQA